MKSTIKLFSVAIPLMYCLSNGVANATIVDVPATFGSTDNLFSRTFSINASDYVSEPSIFSDTINFSLGTAQTVSFFANAFSGPFKFHQIDLIYAGGNYITGTSQDKGPFEFSYALSPGNYQVNYKGAPDVWNNKPDLNLSGSYLAGISVGPLDLPINTASISAGPLDLPINTAAVPEPETYLMLLAGLALIGVSIRRKC